MEKIKILIADDHRVLADGLKALLVSEPEFEVTDIAANGLEVLELLKRQVVDVVLLDISMPQMDGLETTLHIKKQHPDVQVLILSTHDDGSMVNAVLQNGASGYVLKNASTQKLVTSIKAVAAGQKVLSSHLTTQMIDFMQKGPSGQSPGNLKVTRREREILQLISLEFTTKEIGHKLFVSPNTVVTHKRNLFVKFDVKNSVGLIKKALEMGFIEEES